MDSTGTLDADAAVLAAFGTAVDALAAVSAEAATYGSLAESTIVALVRIAAECQRLAGTVGAVIAGEVAHRSAPALGSEGLAQRSGHRTPENFLKQTTGISGREATTAVKVGRIVHEAATAGLVDVATGEIATPAEPWLAPVAAALVAGTVSVGATESIRAGLGTPNPAVSVDQLLHAAAQLCDEARMLDSDRVLRRARELRDELDLDGVALREEQFRQQRAIRITELPSGMGRLIWDLPPELFAAVKETYDRATSPKLGGVRFLAPEQKRLSDTIHDDLRTVAQLASDVFEQLLRAGADADTGHLLGSGAPVIRITATRHSIETGVGLGRIEGVSAPVSTGTVQRLRCEGTCTDITFDQHGHPLNLGREKRAYTKAQRTAMAVRDGGCMHPGCDRPPSWCETHHIVFWARDRGETNIDDGILLCRHHHLLYHNQGWEIVRDERGFWLIPPKEVDPNQERIEMPSTSAALRDLQREHERAHA